jgi:hypothetical protein
VRIAVAHRTVSWLRTRRNEAAGGENDKIQHREHG